MGRRGPTAKPTALKVLAGNPNHEALPENEPQPKSDAVACPAWLAIDAKKEWKRLAPEMMRLGILTNADVTAFAAYCTAYANWKQAQIYINEYGPTVETPNGYMQPSPYVAIAKNALNDMKIFCQEVGLTPSSRARITGGLAASKDEEVDPMEALLNRQWG